MPDTELRTAAANRARMRASEEKSATHLRDRGWICIPPDADLENEFPHINNWALRGVLSLSYGLGEA